MTLEVKNEDCNTNFLVPDSDHLSRHQEDTMLCVCPAPKAWLLGTIGSTTELCGNLPLIMHDSYSFPFPIFQTSSVTTNCSLTVKETG